MLLHCAIGAICAISHGDIPIDADSAAGRREVIEFPIPLWHLGSNSSYSSGGLSRTQGVRIAAQGERVPFVLTSSGSRASAGHDRDNSFWFCNAVALAGDWLVGIATTLITKLLSTFLYFLPATVQPVTAIQCSTIPCFIGLFRVVLFLVRSLVRHRPVGGLGYWSTHRFVRVGIWFHLMVLCLGSSTLFYTTTSYVINVAYFGIASAFSPALLPPPVAGNKHFQTNKNIP